MHALIIEDEPLIAMAIEEALRDCGYSSFAFATSVEQAVGAAKLQCPDLISADVELRPGSGIDAVAAICGGEPIPVIFVTGTADDVHLRRPGSIIVHKPFSNSDIMQAVGRARDHTLSDDGAYYRKRAEVERSLAARSPGNDVAAIHDELADQYEALANQPALRSDFRIKWSCPTSSRPPDRESSTG